MKSPIDKIKSFLRNPSLAEHQESMDVNENLSAIKDTLGEIAGFYAISNVDDKKTLKVKGLKGADGVDGTDGKDGLDGTDGVDGTDGLDGTDGTDGKDGYTPVKGKDYFDGKDGYTPVKGKDYFDGNIKDLSPQEIRDALELLSKGEKLSIQSIEDLGEIIEELRKFKKEVGSGGGGGFTSPIYNFVDDEVPAGTINGTNTVFTVARLPFRGSLKLYRGGARQRVTEDYTLSADQKTVTFLIAPQVGEILLCDYRNL